jgi:tryptophan-rich sensory protein
MLATDQAIGFFLWFGLAYAVGGSTGLLQHHAIRRRWFSKLQKPARAEEDWPTLYVVGWVILHLLGAYATWRVYIVDAARTSGLGVGLQFVYLAHLVVLVFVGIAFKYFKSLGTLAALYVLAAATAAVCLGLYAGIAYGTHATMSGKHMPIIAWAIYTAGQLVPLVLHLWVMCKNDEDEDGNL